MTTTAPPFAPRARLTPETKSKLAGFALIAFGVMTLPLLWRARPTPPEEPVAKVFLAVSLGDASTAQMTNIVLAPPTAGEETTYFLGEIKNTSDKPVATPAALVEVQDERGQALAALPCESPVAVLEPGQTVGCSLQFAETRRAARTNVSLTPRALDPKASLVAVRTTPLVFTPPRPDAFAVVQAELVNDGELPLKDVGYSVSLYSSKGEVVGVVDGSVAALGPHESKEIQAEVHFLNGVPARQTVRAMGYR